MRCSETAFSAKIAKYCVSGLSFRMSATLVPISSANFAYSFGSWGSSNAHLAGPRTMMRVAGNIPHSRRVLASLAEATRVPAARSR